MIFQTSTANNLSEKMRLTTGGVLQIGTTTNRLSEKLHVLGQGIVVSSAENTNLLLFGNFSTAKGLLGAFSNIKFTFRQNNTDTFSMVESGHIIFHRDSAQRVAFGTADGSKYAGFGRADGAAQDVGLNFFTTTNAGINFVNHFRIDHNGDLLGTDTSISSISDSRVKTDITDYTYDLAKFKQFTPKQFNWKNPEYHGEKTNVKGFLAQDLEAIDTEWIGSSYIEKNHPDYDLVDKSKNSQDEDVGVAKTSKFGSKDAMYISVINQMISKIETLETKVAALEAA